VRLIFSKSIWVTLVVILFGCQFALSQSSAQNKEKSSTSKQEDYNAADKKTAQVSPRKLSADELDKLLTVIEKELGTIKSLKTEFIQEKHLSIFSDIIKAKGICLFKAPDLVRFEISEPFQSSLVARQKKVAKFEMIKGKWQKLKLPSRDIILMVTKQIATWLRGRFRDKNGIYDISATVGKDTTIVLIPKDKNFRKNMSAIELVLAKNKKHIAAVRLLEAGGDFTIMKFIKQQRDIELPDEIFSTSGSAPTKIKLPGKKPDSSAETKSKSRGGN
jgi:outer membrane lipoprotein-sorting protein